MGDDSRWAVWASIVATVISNVRVNAAHAILGMMIEDDFVWG